MTEKQLQALDREWKERLRASGFQDIEAPSKMIQRTKRVSPARLKKVAQLDVDRVFLATHAFATPFQRRVWELRCEGLSNRKIAEKLAVYRKLINETVWAVQAKQGRKLRGRPREPDSMRSHDVKLFVRLGPAHIEAMDHIRAVLNVNAQEALRAGVVEFAKRISVKQGANVPMGR